ncbi:FecR family protein [Luteibacter sp.]|jgi:transmembrane sensor|uniref:FecR family protein n=1 Tax=Luteibacter sp. TaxID=1886636 RepID=UPI002F40AA82
MNNGRRLTEEAANWYLTMREDVDARTRDRFSGWLHRSAQHVAEYLAVAQLHGDMRAAAAMDATSLEGLRELAASEPSVVPFRREPERVRAAAPAAGTRRRWNTLRIGGISAAVAALLMVSAALLLAWPASEPPAVRYVAGASQVRMVALEDDTQLQLSPGSMVDVHFDEHSRHIALIKGDASFDIGKDVHRPMTVAAGKQRIEDIGTVFDVSLGATVTEVSVVSGRVTVSSTASPWLDRARRRLTGEGAPRQHIVELGGGESASVSTDGKLVSRGFIDASTAATWLPDEIRFHDSTVAEVARRFNTYTPRPLTVEDPNLARKRISGVFHARDAAAFVSYLASLPGVTVLDDPEHIRFVAARSGKRL